MDQHPIPGAITTYKFKLVGDMTLKQFLELAGGGVTAWIIFNSKINFLFKFTLGPLFAMFGFALAFLPIEDRPLDQWIVSFIKAIYSPTQFIYITKPKKLDIFESITRKMTPAAGPGFRQGYGGQGQLDEYLESLPPSGTSVFDQAEAKYLDYIANLFSALGNKIIPGTISKPSAQAPTKTNVKGVRVRQLSHPQVCLLPRATVFQAPAETREAAMPTLTISKPKTQTPNQTQSSNVKIPPAQPVSIPPQLQPKIDKPAAQTQPAPQVITPPPTATPSQNTVGPTFADDILIPQKPEKPNIIAGITLDKDGKILADTILEIRDNDGFPVRALKANKLGQFFIATPLKDGIYEIHCEHPQYKFAIIRLEAKNEIIPPLKIQAVA